MGRICFLFSRIFLEILLMMNEIRLSRHCLRDSRCLPYVIRWMRRKIIWNDSKTASPIKPPKAIGFSWANDFKSPVEAPFHASSNADHHVNQRKRTLRATQSQSFHMFLFRFHLLATRLTSRIVVSWRKTHPSPMPWRNSSHRCGKCWHVKYESKSKKRRQRLNARCELD